jgi:hypothetical protein
MFQNRSPYRGGTSLHNLKQTISDLVPLAKSQPEGDLRNRLFEETSALDSIADSIRQALDSLI